jgi:hypothetical protein
LYFRSCCQEFPYNFLAQLLSHDSFQAGMAVFYFLTGIGLVLTIADDFSAFSCPTEIEPV